MPLVNTSDPIGTTIIYMTTNITGSEFLTYFLILIACFLLASMFRIPTEYSIAYLLPVVIVLMAYSSGWMAIGGIILIYISLILISRLPFG